MPEPATAEYKTGDLLGIVDLELNMKERNKTLLANRLVLVVAALLVMVLSVAVFYTLFRYMVVRPVQHLKDVADRAGEGDLRVRSEIDTGNELEALSDAMNHMLEATAKAQADLRAATEARDAKLDELARANVALFEMNQVKNKFLTTMSHELRTPLNSILGFAQILRDAPAAESDPKLARYAENIVTSGRMLLEMINDLLDLAKIEAGRLQVRCEKVSPPDIAEAVCNMVRPMLGETPLKLSYEVDPATPLMTTDATKVQQILYNLLSNAIKFTAEGEVRLAVRPGGGPLRGFCRVRHGHGHPARRATQDLRAVHATGFQLHAAVSWYGVGPLNRKRVDGIAGRHGFGRERSGSRVHLYGGPAGRFERRRRSWFGERGGPGPIGQRRRRECGAGLTSIRPARRKCGKGKHHVDPVSVSLWAQHGGGVGPRGSGRHSAPTASAL